MTSPVPLEERAGRADLWEATAAERERLADERERLADERDSLADDRERLADRHEAGQERRDEEDLRQRRLSDEDGDDRAELAARMAAVRRAEAAVQRAEAQLVRASLAASRMAARADRRAAECERTTAAEQRIAGVDVVGRAWLADRRDFVAVDRERLADERDRLADRRDETADARERLADARELDALEHVRRSERRPPTGRQADRTRHATEQERAEIDDRRAWGEAQRRRVAAARRSAAHGRASASARWGPQPYGPMLVASFADLATQLFGSDDLTDVLPRILKFTVDMVAGCDWASVTLWRHGQVVDTLSHGTVAAELDDIQFASGIGPGPDALRNTDPVYVPDLASASWGPVLAATAADLGATSALCHGLFVHHPAQWSAVGTLNLYGGTPDAFSDTDQEFATILAAYVAVAVAARYRRDEIDRREAALHRSLSTRDVIGQAKGILMERQRLSAGEAFDVLRRASQRLNRKVADVAQRLTETGELPT